MNWEPKTTTNVKVSLLNLLIMRYSDLYFFCNLLINILFQIFYQVYYIKTILKILKINYNRTQYLQTN